MFCGGHNSEFREQNFAHKSEHDKRVLQRNSGKDFATFFEGAREGIGRILSRTKVTLERVEFEAKESVAQSAKRRCWGCKKKRKSVCDNRPEWFSEERMPITQGKILEGLMNHTDDRKT